jgi:hypothetical protein
VGLQPLLHKMQWFATGKSITTSVAFINQRFSGSALVAAEIIKTIKSSRSSTTSKHKVYVCNWY